MTAFKLAAIRVALLVVCLVAVRPVFAYPFPEGQDGTIPREHRRLADAIEAGDLERAKEADYELDSRHIVGLDEYLLRVSSRSNQHVVQYFRDKYKLVISDFWLGVAAGDLELVRNLLIEDNAMTRSQLREGNPMVMAVLRHDLSMVELLLEFGASPDRGVSRFPQVSHYDDPHTPLHEAIRLGDIKLVKVLLEAGARVNVRDYAMSVSPNVMYQGKSVRELVLMNSWSDTDPVEMRKRFWTQREQQIDFFLEEGLINKVPHPEFTVAPPLRAAIKSGRLEIVRLLLEGGADPSIPFGEESTALIDAVQSGHPGMVKLLIDSGVDVNQPDGRDRTPLSQAYQKGDIADMLVAAGAKLRLESGEN